MNTSSSLLLKITSRRVSWKQSSARGSCSDHALLTRYDMSLFDGFDNGYYRNHSRFRPPFLCCSISPQMQEHYHRIRECSCKSLRQRFNLIRRSEAYWRLYLHLLYLLGCRSWPRRTRHCCFLYKHLLLSFPSLKMATRQTLYRFCFRLYVRSSETGSPWIIPWVNLLEKHSHILRGRIRRFWESWSRSWKKTTGRVFRRAWGGRCSNNSKQDHHRQLPQRLFKKLTSTNTKKDSLIS